MSPGDYRELARAIVACHDATDVVLGTVSQGDFAELQTAVRETAPTFEARCVELADKCGLAAYMRESFDPFASQETPRAVVDTFLVGALEEFDSGTQAALDAAWEMFALGWVLRQLELELNGAQTSRCEGVDIVDLDRQRNIVTLAFWERFELTLFRLCGAWDRGAQVLAYIFFNLREFDRDTFPAVLDRLKSNYARDDMLFAAHASWQALMHYGEDESERGYHELARRRNVLTHSVGLEYYKCDDKGGGEGRPRNALDVKRARKLRQESPDIEINWVTQHARQLVRLRLEVVGLCHFGLATYGLRPLRFGSPKQ